MSQTPEQYIVITVSQNNPWLMNRDTHTLLHYITYTVLHHIALHWHTNFYQPWLLWMRRLLHHFSLRSAGEFRFGYRFSAAVRFETMNVLQGRRMHVGGPPIIQSSWMTFSERIETYGHLGIPDFKKPPYIYCRGVVMFFVVMLRNIFYLFEGGKCRTWSDRNCICMVKMGTLLWHIHSFNY